MPPRKKQKTELEQDLARFIEQAVAEFNRAKRGSQETITAFKFKQIVANKLELNSDENLLTEEDKNNGISLERFVELVELTKKENDMSLLVDYIYDYLSYSHQEGSEKGDKTVTHDTFSKALRTIPKAPKREKTVDQMFYFAATLASKSKECISRDDLVRIMRRLNFFSRHHNSFNVNESFNSDNKSRG
jgi:Ca2+-binding EF-hand superfamily protein